MKLKKYERQMMNYKLKFVPLHPQTFNLRKNAGNIHSRN